MATWTAKDLDVTCGGCWAVIPPMQGFAEFTVAKLPRCRSCAELNGAIYNDQQVDDARFKIERQQRLEAEKALTPTQAFVQTTPRVPPANRPRSFNSLGDLADQFDPKMAAAGEDR